MKTISRAAALVGKRSFFAFALIMSIAWHDAGAQVCSSFTVYALDNQGYVYTVNTSTGALGTPLNNSGVAAGSSSSNAMGYSRTSSKFYYFSDVNTGGGSKFISYDGASTYANLAGPFTAGSNNYSVLGTATADGKGFYVLDASALIWYYNITANTWTKVVTTKIVDNAGNNLSTQFSSLGSGDIVEDGYGTLWLIPSGGTTYGIYYITNPPTTPVATVTATQVLKYNTALPAKAVTAGEHWGGAAFDLTGNLYLATLSYLYVMPIGTTTLSFVGNFTGMKAGGTGVFDLAQCTYTSDPLPLIWSSFSATEKDGSADLEWGIAQPSQLKGFYVERSTDGTRWDTLGFVPYSDGVLSYDFTDGSPSPGSNFYRIAQLDQDGKGMYSAVREVGIQNSSGIRIWPNPAVDIVHVQYSGSAARPSAQLFDQLGRAVRTFALAQGRNEISLSGLPAGPYFLVIRENSTLSSCKKIFKKF